MLGAILLILVVLWFFGYIHVDGLSVPNFPLFVVNGHAITLWEVLILLVILWAIEALPGSLRSIGVVLLIVWLLATLGVISIMGLPQVVVVLLVIGLVLALLGVL